MSRPALVASLFAILAAIVPAGADTIPDDIGMRFARDFAQPAAKHFADGAATMQERARELCAHPDAASLEAARDGLRDLVGAWGSLSVLRFGPVQADNRYERVFFWPDPRGVILRQVQSLLAEADEEALAPGALAGRSVAVQGLPALEFLLHGSGADDLATGADGYRCRYGAAIAANLAHIAEAIAEAWNAGAFRDAFTMPSPDRDLYRSKREVAGEIVKAIATTLQFTRNAELMPALGSGADEARGKRAPLWRGNLTFVLIRARLDGILDLLAATGFDADPTVAVYVDALAFDLTHARDALARIVTPAENAFADSGDRGLLTYVAAALHGANETVGGSLSGALGLTMGFNALDGD